MEIGSSIKQLRSFDGIRIISPNERNNRIPEKTASFNAIPVKTTYQLNIYTKYKLEAEEYVRNFLFKLINNPQIVVDIPYNNLNMKHTAYLRVLDTVSDTSDIAQRLFTGQFYRMTIQMELQDGYLFNLPYRTNWSIVSSELCVNSVIGTDVETSQIFDHSIES